MELRRVLGLGLVVALGIVFVPAVKAGSFEGSSGVTAPAVPSVPSACTEFAGQPFLFLNAPSDNGCCTIQKVKGTDTWECSSTTRRDCVDRVKAAGLEREYQRWAFYKDQRCQSVLQCD